MFTCIFNVRAKHQESCCTPPQLKELGWLNCANYVSPQLQQSYISEESLIRRTRLPLMTTLIRMSVNKVRPEDYPLILS